MAKIGDEKYCELSVEKAIESAEVLVNNFGGDVGSEEAFAQALGHASSNSGTYYTKVADLRRFGILPSRGLEATDLAERLASPRNPQEKADAIFEMLNNVSILSEVYERLNGGEPPEDFWRVLTEITSTNPKEAREAAPPIEEQYRVMKEADRRRKKEEESEEEVSQETIDTSQEQVEKSPETSPSDSPIYVKVGDDELRLSKVNDAYIGIAQDFLERLKARERPKFNSESEEESEQTRIT